MAEQLNTPEHANVLQTETSAEAVQRLQAELEFKPWQPDDTIGLSYVGYRQPSGNYQWNRMYGNQPPEGSVAADPQSHPEDQQVFDYAADNARQDTILLRQLARQEGKWWINSSAEGSVDNNLREGFRVHEGDQTLDILNCSNEDLTDGDRASIAKVFNAITNFTGNKIFDRITGVVLAAGSEFKSDASGDYQPMSGVVRINVDSLHERADLGRYSTYFQEGQTDWFEIVMAHELGHAMDLSTLDEVEAHAIDKGDMQWNGFGGRTKDFSSFQNLPAWEHHSIVSEETISGKKTIWNLDLTVELECREYAPTGYARTNPREDFAESFAITTLGGDTTKLVQRQALINETIYKAEGEAQIGPKLVTLAELSSDDLQGAPLKSVGFKAYIHAPRSIS